jgi:hypothetical protein
VEVGGSQFKANLGITISEKSKAKAKGQEA